MKDNSPNNYIAAPIIDDVVSVFEDFQTLDDIKKTKQGKKTRYTCIMYDSAREELVVYGNYMHYNNPLEIRFGKDYAKICSPLRFPQLKETYRNFVEWFELEIKPIDLQEIKSELRKINTTIKHRTSPQNRRF